MLSRCNHRYSETLDCIIIFFNNVGIRVKLYFLRRFSEIFGDQFGSENEQLNRAIALSLEDVPPTNRRRPRKSNDQLPMTEVTT